MAFRSVNRSPHTRLFLAALSTLMLAALACNTLLPSENSSPLTQEPVFAAVALRLDGAESGLRSFVGGGDSLWLLDPGIYAIEIARNDGRTLSLPQTQITDQPFSLPGDPAWQGAANDPERFAAVTTLVNFLMNTEDIKLTVFQNVSQRFTSPLFTTEAGQDELNQLQGDLAMIAAQEIPVMAALKTVFTSYVTSGTPKAAAPQPDIKESLLAFFGYAGDAGERARERILQISEALTIDELNAAFSSVREGFRGSATNSIEFLDLLDSGALDTQAAQIESDMRNSPAFGTSAQANNATVGEVFHKEGAELVTKGAEFQAEVIKGVLGDVFPEITEGFDLADKANEWAEYIQSVYQDPLAAIEGEARGALQEQIKERITASLQQCCPDIAEDLAEQIADAVSEEAVKAIPELAPILQSTQPSSGAGPSATATGVAFPIIDLRSNIFETVSGGTAENFSTDFVLTADYEVGTVIGSISGVSTRLVEFECFNQDNPSDIWDYATVEYGFTYSAQISGGLDTITGEFSAPISPSGYTDFELVQPFTDPRCTDLNSQPAPNIGPFSGSGTISGVVGPTGDAYVATSWQAGSATVSGSWSGQGQVSH